MAVGRISTAGARRTANRRKSLEADVRALRGELSRLQGSKNKVSAPKPGRAAAAVLASSGQPAWPQFYRWLAEIGVEPPAKWRQVSARRPEDVAPLLEKASEYAGLSRVLSDSLPNMARLTAGSSSESRVARVVEIVRLLSWQAGEYMGAQLHLLGRLEKNARYYTTDPGVLHGIALASEPPRGFHPKELTKRLDAALKPYGLDSRSAVRWLTENLSNAHGHDAERIRQGIDALARKPWRKAASWKPVGRVEWPTGVYEIEVARGGGYAFRGKLHGGEWQGDRVLPRWEYPPLGVPIRSSAPDEDPISTPDDVRAGELYSSLAVEPDERMWFLRYKGMLDATRPVMGAEAQMALAGIIENLTAHFGAAWGTRVLIGLGGKVVGRLLEHSEFGNPGSSYSLNLSVAGEALREIGTFRFGTPRRGATAAEMAQTLHDLITKAHAHPRSVS